MRSNELRLVMGSLVGLIVLWGLAGCGGGGDAPGPGTGSVVVRVIWPEQTEETVTPAMIPQAAQSIRVRFIRGTEVVAEGVIVRPESEKVFTDLPGVPLLVTAVAYPTTDGSGVAQAAAETHIVVERDTQISVTLTLVSTIVSVEVSPDPAEVAEGETMQLSATCKDRDGNIVMVAPTVAFTWEVIEGSQYASVDDKGLVTGLAPGTARVQATEKESGVSGLAQVQVVASLPTGTIAFKSDRDGNYEIYVMNADGTNPTNLTNNPADDWYPAWSLDGNKIAFMALRDGNWEIYVMNADGTNQTNLTNNSAYDEFPAWSPDGTKIAFASNRDGNQEIYVMNADGTNPTNLTNNGVADYYPAWSPDGTKIAFTTSRDGNREIYVMNADGTNPTRLTNHLEEDTHPAWSPDGSKIAFTTSRDGDDEIYVMNADGTNPTNLTNHFATDCNPAWSPDGRKIVFASDRDGNGEIYVMNADGANPTRLTNNSASEWYPAWSAMVMPPFGGRGDVGVVIR